MNQTDLCVSIPEELRGYRKCETSFNKAALLDSLPTINFGVKVFKKPDGQLDYIAHYSDNGTLIKKICYESSKISQILHYRSSVLDFKEIFENDLMVKKSYYDKSSNIRSEIMYEYGQTNQIHSITKFQNNSSYKILYGYDELNRINSRTISIDNNIINEQKYKLDILDRIIEYSDFNQKVKVEKMSSDNKLIYYTITDKMGNEISIANSFYDSEYIDTELTLNGHTLKIVDISYVDNVMLKKPYATEDDLDLIISNLFNGKKEYSTYRRSVFESTNEMIQENIQKRALPISLRKRVLYNMSLNAS